ncbi:concanavalin A-like lectin/glucanase domain-containing protein [Aspergillus pseudoustus]|uniref:xyloglucan-specific endo-beta-1,4-glucanase n=1 Tax=Aspergillus pseudoustus TaxID=1810923 RepID=A0ABR4JBY3_9EURO
MKLSHVIFATSIGVTAARSEDWHFKRADTCGQWEIVPAGQFNVYNNLWGQGNGDGEGCVGVDSASSPIAWHSTWTWAGGEGTVKSYQNAVPSNFTPMQVSGLSSIMTSWDWSYEGTDLVANVAYDLFTASSADGAAEFEIMIWLTALGGAGPISTSGSPIAEPAIGGSSWSLYTGTNAATTVYSFVASSPIEAYSGDLVEFLSYLVSDQGFSAQQYVQSIGAGTEPFTGSDAVFTTSGYTLSF